MPKSLQAQIEKLEEEKAKNARQLRQLKARQRVAERKKEQRQSFLVGRAMLDDARNDERVLKYLAKLLNRALTEPGDRKLFDTVFEGIAEWNRKAPVNGNDTERSGTVDLARDQSPRPV